jgi:toxin ParE1/3/4
MRIRWTSPAAADLEGIKSFLDEQYPHIANATIKRIYESILSLRAFPYRGRPGRRIGTRELVLSPLPYIVV